MPSITRPATPYMDAVDALIGRISDSIDSGFQGHVTAVLTGGAAVHAHTGWRTSNDVDLRFSHRMILPDDLVAVYEEGGRRRAVAVDRNYTETIALLHPDCWTEAWDGWRVGRIAVKVLSPIDLAVSKIGRWAGNDEADVRALASAGLITPESVEGRAEEALLFYVGNLKMIRYNLRDALEAIRSCAPRPT